jgi:hypothetical protein
MFPPHFADIFGRMSKRAAFLAFAAAAGAAPAMAASPLTAEQAIEVQQDGIRQAVGAAPCPRDRDTGDIVVCGRRGSDPNRLPLPVERLPGERERLLPGEVPRAQASFSTCVIACQPSGIRIDVIQAIGVGSKIVRHVLGKDD